ncbi:MAG: phage major tail tube protein [Proteobacteria bacterium]|nr:phage major tail tube protein [Pseudomonadota bacterium]
MNRIPIYGQIKSCTIYPVENGVPAASPAAFDCTITPPVVTFETGTVQMMGSLTVPDQSRIADMSLSITVPVSPLSVKLSGKGLKSYEARWAQEVTDPTGAIRVVQGVCYISGYVTQVPATAINPGAEGTADYNVSVVKYRLVVGGKELHNIDRAAGVLVIDTVNYRSEVDALL